MRRNKRAQELAKERYHQGRAAWEENPKNPVNILNRYFSLQRRLENHRNQSDQAYGWGMDMIKKEEEKALEAFRISGVLPDGIEEEISEMQSRVSKLDKWKREDTTGW